MIVVQLAFDATPQRLAARPAHRAFLETLRQDGDLLDAGPWSDDSGALLVFRCSRAHVDQIMTTDPYYSTAGVSVLSVREWMPLLGG